ncbi:hypothetical protein [Sphingomonas sp.]|uniref:hypothetical protein n=1 Tax=Sphingomonas sp. TaxID=28214 RepID=UPI002FD9BC9A
MESGSVMGEHCPASTLQLESRVALAREQLLASAPDLREWQEAGRQSRFAYGNVSGPVVMRLVVDPPNLLLHFAEGAALPDPAGLLRGVGRRGRYVCLGAVKAQDRPALLALIGAALCNGNECRSQT